MASPPLFSFDRGPQGTRRTQMPLFESSTPKTDPGELMLLKVQSVVRG